MTRQCEVCGERFAAKRSDARTCSQACRNRLKREAVRARRVRVAADDPLPVAVAEAVLAELVKAGRETSALGQSALVLAGRIDGSAGESPQAVAALVKQLVATLDRVRDGVPAPRTIVDELIERRLDRVRRMAGVS